MNVGAESVTVAEHATIGPVRIAIHQPRPLASPEDRMAEISEFLYCILQEVTAIRKHLTRPPWWRRLWNRITHVELRS